jgi:Anti-sigma factor N-terminus
MRGIVVEKENGHTIILTKKGEFIKVKDKREFAVGDEYIPNNNYRFTSNTFLDRDSKFGKVIPLIYNKKVVAIAASFALIFGVSTAAYGYVSPSKYINIDINPSVELVANRYNKIIKVKSLNEDGTKIIEDLSLKNKSITEAVNLVMEAVKEDGYLAQELGNEILITVASKNETYAKEIEMELTEIVKQELVKENIEETPVTIGSVGLEVHEEAEKLGVSPGKLNLIQKLQEVNPEINYEEYSNKSVQEIMKAVKDVKKEEKPTSNEEKQIETAPTTGEDKKDNMQNNNGNNNGNNINVNSDDKKQAEIKKENNGKDNGNKNINNEVKKENKQTKNEKKSEGEQELNNSRKKNNFFNKLFKN